MIRNEKGFSFTALLVSLPLLLSVLCGLVITGYYVNGFNKYQDICRTTILQTQGQLRQTFEQLLALNPIAEGLRMERQMAEVALVLAIVAENPPAIVKAQARLRVVKSRQRSLNMTQKGLLMRATSLRHQVRPQLQAKRPSAPFQFTVRNGVSSGLAVYAKPKKSLSPNYEPQSYFTKRQVIYVQWKGPVAKFLPRWIPRDFVALLAPHIRGQCAASIQKRRSKWFATPIKAKFY